MGTPKTRKRPDLARHYRRWTRGDVKILRDLWGTVTLATIAEKLGRSPLTVYYFATKAGLQRGCPQGYEYLTAAATRTGFDTGQLRVILASAGVKLRVVMALPKKRRHYHVVSPDIVDEAVDAWMKLEGLPDAARRLGTTREVVRAALVAAGHEPPPLKFRWRVLPSVADEAMATYRPGASVRSHAARLAMNRTTLAGRLRTMGVLHEKRGGVEVRLTDAVVDEALRRFEAQRDPKKKRKTKGERR